MKVYLDDERPVPDGWYLVKTAHEAIDALKAGTVTHISLDHDLGDETVVGTGYDVLLWLEEAVFTKDFAPPVISIHTANISARTKMELAAQQIEARANRL